MDKDTAALERRIRGLDFARLMDGEPNAFEHWLAGKASQEHLDVLLDASIRQGVEDKDRAKLEASIPKPPQPKARETPAYVKALPANLLTKDEFPALERTLRGGARDSDESVLQAAAHRLLPKEGASA